MGNCLVPELERHAKTLHSRKVSWKKDKATSLAAGQKKEVAKRTPSTTTADKELRVFKILILGTGESGKSTLVKQMKIIHNEGYTLDEMEQFRVGVCVCIVSLLTPNYFLQPIILDNLVSSMKYVVTGMRLLQIPFQYPSNQNLAKELIVCDKYLDEEDGLLLPHLEFTLKTLWDDGGVKEAVLRGFEYELNDSCLYFFENMERLCGEKYVANTKDILKSRVRTIGVVETEFRIDNLVVRMYDVGGQRSERRKWIQCFDDVCALLFVVAISEYDMTLVEDCDRNRLRESLQLFESICSNIFFRNTCTVGFLKGCFVF